MGGNGISKLQQQNWASHRSFTQWEQKTILKHKLKPKLTHTLSSTSPNEDRVYQAVNQSSSSSPTSSSSKLYILKMVHLYQKNEVCHLLEGGIKGKKLSNILNVVDMGELNEGSFCNSSLVVMGLFEYVGEYSLQKQIQIRQSDTEGENYFSFSQIVRIFKFILNVLKEIQACPNLWHPIVSPENILFHEENGLLKYKNPIESTYFPNPCQNHVYYCPCNWGRVNEQSQSIFSFGMTMISICLLTSLNDCYDLKNYSMCLSILEEKVEAMRKMHQSEFWQYFCDMIEQMIEMQPSKRPTVQECSGMCNQLLSRLRKEENEKTQYLDDISNTYSKIINRTENTSECGFERKSQFSI